MPGQLTISLSNLRMYAYHGLYPEEQRAGNHFTLDCTVHYDTPETPVSSLDQTLDYGALFSFLQQQMQEREDLLETWVMKTASRIKAAWPRVQRVQLRITKETPPIPGFTGAVAVAYETDFR